MALTYEIAAIDNDPGAGDIDTSKQYAFQDLQGRVIRATERIEILRRKGVDGHGARKIGKVGEIFPLVSLEYITFDTDLDTTLQNAIARVQLYEALKGQPLGVRVTQRSIVTAPCEVVEVMEAETPAEIVAAAGSLVANPRVVLKCVWRLIHRGT